MSRLRPKTLLIGLLIVWGALIVHLLVNREPTRRAPKVYVSGKPAPRTVGRTVEGENDLSVHLNRLSAPPAGSREAKKNIFSPIQVFVPKAPTPKPTITPMPTATPTDLERAQAVSRAEMANYKYVGYLDRQGRATAVIARGEELFTVRKGKTIFGSIRLKEVQPDSVVILDANTQMESTLPLTSR